MTHPHISRAATSLALLLAFGAVPQIHAPGFKPQPVLAQSLTTPAFPLPETIAEGTRVTIQNSSTMATIAEALQQQFESQYAGTTVQLNTTDADAALQAVRDGSADLAAIGRPLTATEKAEGLVEVPIARHKIALFTRADSPFQGSLDIEQFAQIFRGDITNWEQVGGPSAPVKLIDRPASSDTRQSFQNYPIFQSAPFNAGANAVAVDDKTTQVIENLGPDGVGYAIADQVLNQPGVRLIPMYNTLPDDPRYPFSQQLTYVYKGPEANEAVRAFLGFATTPENAAVIERARVEAVTAASPVPAAVESPAAAETPVTTETPATNAAPTEATSTEQTTARRGGFPWWLLLLPLLLIPFFLLRRKPSAAPVVVMGDRRSRLVLTPRNCRDAYAYWELSDEDRAALHQEGNRPAIRLYEVTGINLDTQEAHSMRQFDLASKAEDAHLPIPLDDQDYLAELGYTARDGRWVRIARSEHVRVPACEPINPEVGNRYGAAVPMGAAAMSVGLAGLSGREAQPHRVIRDSKIILVPRSTSDAYAYWEISGEQKAALRQQGGKDLKLRLYDVTGVDLDTEQPNSIREFDCNELEQDRHLPIYTGDRDYLVELGYTTEDGRWLSLVRSPHVHIPQTPTDTPAWNAV